MDIARIDLDAGKFCGHIPDVIGVRDIVDLDFTGRTLPTSENTPRYILMSFVFVSHKRIRQHPL